MKRGAQYWWPRVRFEKEFKVIGNLLLFTGGPRRVRSRQLEVHSGDWHLVWKGAFDLWGKRFVSLREQVSMTNEQFFFFYYRREFCRWDNWGWYRRSHAPEIGVWDKSQTTHFQKEWGFYLLLTPRYIEGAYCAPLFIFTYSPHSMSKAFSVLLCNNNQVVSLLP